MLFNPADESRKSSDTTTDCCRMSVERLGSRTQAMFRQICLNQCWSSHPSKFVSHPYLARTLMTVKKNSEVTAESNEEDGLRHCWPETEVIREDVYRNCSEKDFIETNTSVPLNSDRIMTIRSRRPVCFTCGPGLRWWQRERSEYRAYWTSGQSMRKSKKRDKMILTGMTSMSYVGKVLPVDTHHQRLRRRKRRWRFTSVAFGGYEEVFISTHSFFLSCVCRDRVFGDMSIDSQSSAATRHQ